MNISTIFKIFDLLILFYMNECFDYMDICAPRVCLQMVVVWVLGTEPGFSPIKNKCS